jgi:hypothetical protein
MSGNQLIGGSRIAGSGQLMGSGMMVRGGQVSGEARGNASGGVTSDKNLLSRGRIKGGYSSFNKKNRWPSSWSSPSLSLSLLL